LFSANGLNADRAPAARFPTVPQGTISQIKCFTGCPVALGAPELHGLLSLRQKRGSEMTPLDGLLVIAGFALGCLPMVEWRLRRASVGPFKRVERRLAASPWI
jgi:hypothetical protein